MQRQQNNNQRNNQNYRSNNSNNNNYRNNYNNQDSQSSSDEDGNNGQRNNYNNNQRNNQNNNYSNRNNYNNNGGRNNYNNNGNINNYNNNGNRNNYNNNGNRNNYNNNGNRNNYNNNGNRNNYNNNNGNRNNYNNNNNENRNQYNNTYNGNNQRQNNNNNSQIKQQNQNKLTVKQAYMKFLERQHEIIGGALVIKNEDKFKQFVESENKQEFLNENIDIFEFQTNDLDIQQKKIPVSSMNIKEYPQDDKILLQLIEYFNDKKKNQSDEPQKQKQRKTTAQENQKQEENEEEKEEKEDDKIDNQEVEQVNEEDIQKSQQQILEKIIPQKKLQCTFKFMSWDENQKVPTVKLVSINKIYKNKTQFMNDIVVATQNSVCIHDFYLSKDEIKQELQQKTLLQGIMHVINEQKFYIKTDQDKVFFSNKDISLANRALHNNQVYYQPQQVNQNNNNKQHQQKKPFAQYVWGLNRNNDQFSKPLYGIIFKVHKDQIKNTYCTKIDQSFFQSDNMFEDLNSQDINLIDIELTEEQKLIQEKYKKEKILDEKLYFRSINMELPPMQVVNINLENVLKHPAFNTEKLIFKAYFIDWVPQSDVPYVYITDIEGSIGNDETFSRVYLKECNVKTDKFDPKIIKQIENNFCDIQVVDDKKLKTLKIDKKERKYRKDLTNLLTFSFDGKNTKQLDDAISFIRKKNTQNGMVVYQMYIHIADVSYILNSENLEDLNQDAKERKQASYFKKFMRPMIPEILGRNICSLIENQERYAVTLYLEINEDGMIDFEKVNVYETIVKNDLKLNYQQIDQFINQDDAQSLEDTIDNSNCDINKEEFLQNIKELHKICQKRFKIHNDLGYNCSGNQEEEEVANVENNFNDIIIQELMVLSNECVLHFCGNLDKNVDSYQKELKEYNLKQKQIQQQKKLEKKRLKEEQKKKKQEEKLRKQELKKQQKEKLKKLKEQKEKSELTEEQKKELEKQIEEEQKNEQALEQEDKQVTDDEKDEDQESISDTEAETHVSDISDVESQKNYSDNDDTDDDDDDAFDMGKIVLADAYRQKRYLQELFGQLGLDNLSFESSIEFKKGVQQVKEINKDFPLVLEFIKYKCILSSRKVQIVIANEIKERKKREKNNKKNEILSEDSNENNEIQPKKEKKNDQKDKSSQKKEYKVKEEKKENEIKSNKDSDKCQQKKNDNKNTIQNVLEQIEFYFGDKNIQQDCFLYQLVMESGDEGYIKFSIIEGFKKVQDYKLTTEEIIEQMKGSQIIEIKKEDEVYLIRRLNNKKLPKYIGKKKLNIKKQNKNNNRRQQKNKDKEEQEQVTQQTQESQKTEQISQKIQNTDKSQEETEKINKDQDNTEKSQEQTEKINKDQDNTEKSNVIQEKTEKSDENQEKTEKSDENQEKTEKSDENQENSEKPDQVQEKTEKSDENQKNSEKLDQVQENTQDKDENREEEKEEQQKSEEIQESKKDKLEKKSKFKKVSEIEVECRKILNQITQNIIDSYNNFDSQVNINVIEKYIGKKKQELLPFTNPLRSYSDVMTHNLVKDYMDFYQDLEDYRGNMSKKNLQKLKDFRDDIADYKNKIKKYQIDSNLVGEKGVDKAERFIQKRDIIKSLVQEGNQITQAVVCYSSKFKVTVWSPLTQDEEDMVINNTNSVKMFDTVEIDISSKNTFPFQYTVQFRKLIYPYKKQQQQ